MPAAAKMKINILHMIEGAKKARGAAVIIDVFRAFSFECYLINNNAEKIIPVASKEFAYELKKNNPGYILVGERRGVILPGFDYGNSPAQIENIDFTGKTIIHTTSAGTQGLENASGADVVLTGSLVNAGAIANYILENKFTKVSLVCMGLDVSIPTEEDNLCAEYIKSLLNGNIINIKDEIENLKLSSGKKFFDASQRKVFPTRDFELCTALNRFDFVLKLEYDTTGLAYIRKVENCEPNLLDPAGRIY